MWQTNGHAYLLVEGPVTFTQALMEASSFYWTEAGYGYLATITSDIEQGFIYNYTNSIADAGINTYWIGGYKSSSADWRWINGW